MNNKPPLYTFLKSSILGTPHQSNTTHYNIIGAGFAGLMLAYFLQKKGMQVSIYEKNSYTGGLLQTQQTAHGIVEQAANGFLYSKAIEIVCNDLNINILRANTITKNRFILRNNRFRKMPLSFFEILEASAKLAMPKSPKYCHTVANFCEQYTGKSVQYQLFEPALQGIFAGNLHELGFAATLSSIAKVQQNSHSLLLGFVKNMLNTNKQQAKKTLKGTLSFEMGMQTLTKALSTHLQKNIVYNADIQQIDFEQPTIICTPAYITANFFKQVDFNMYALLNQVEYAQIYSCTFFVQKTDLQRFKAGFGCLIPQREGYNILGILFNNCIFENRTVSNAVASFTVIARNNKQKNWHLLKNEQVIALFWADVQQILGILPPTLPLHAELTYWQKGIPIYTPDVQHNWLLINNLMQKKHKHIRLFGNYTGEISLRGMANAALEWVQ